MSMDMGIVDRWLRLKYPENYTPEILERVHRTVDQSMRRAGFESVHDPAIDQRARDALKALLAEYDTTILEALGTDLDGVLDALAAQSARKRGGSTRSRHQQEMIGVALEAFFEAERMRLGFSGAVDLGMQALDAHRPNHTIKRSTVVSWLKELAGMPWCEIPEPKRGRPKKAP
ncbi:hypothetical protein [Thioalkalivibrio sp. ALJ15]|uniref:hypothetical protein n=1 Tax=Thioalkalivibrio sp. ALJ15 TaxID=748652 RepID=UPI0003745807|nr:hypothetical protein [Thioalkalivibrio sp. ALJ15]